MKAPKLLVLLIISLILLMPFGFAWSAKVKEHPGSTGCYETISGDRDFNDGDVFPNKCDGSYFICACGGVHYHDSISEIQVSGISSCEKVAIKDKSSIWHEYGLGTSAVLPDNNARSIAFRSEQYLCNANGGIWATGSISGSCLDINCCSPGEAISIFGPGNTKLCENGAEVVCDSSKLGELHGSYVCDGTNWADASALSDTYQSVCEDTVENKGEKVFLDDGLTETENKCCGNSKPFFNEEFNMPDAADVSSLPDFTFKNTWINSGVGYLTKGPYGEILDGALKITFSETGGFITKDSVLLNPGQYIISAKIKAGDGDPSSVFGTILCSPIGAKPISIAVIDVNNNVLGYIDSCGQHDWQSEQGSFTVSAPTNIKIYIGGRNPESVLQLPQAATGAIFIDNLKLLGPQSDLGSIVDGDPVGNNKNQLCDLENNLWSWKNAAITPFKIVSVDGWYDVISNGNSWFACAASGAAGNPFPDILTAQDAAVGQPLTVPYVYVASLVTEEELAVSGSESGLFVEGQSSSSIENSLTIEDFALDLTSIDIGQGKEVQTGSNVLSIDVAEIRSIDDVIIRINGLPSGYFIAANDIKVVSGSNQIGTTHLQTQVAGSVAGPIQIDLPDDLAEGTYDLQVTVLSSLSPSVVYKTILFEDVFTVIATINSGISEGAFNVQTIDPERFLCNQQDNPSAIPSFGVITECCGPSYSYCLNERNKTRISGGPTALLEDYVCDDIQNCVRRTAFSEIDGISSGLNYLEHGIMLPTGTYEDQDFSITDWDSYDSLEFDIYLAGSNKLNISILSGFDPAGNVLLTRDYSLLNEPVVKYSLTGSELNKWHHIKIPLTAAVKSGSPKKIRLYADQRQILNDIGDTRIIIGGQNKIMIIGRDRFYLSSENTKFCGTNFNIFEQGITSIGRWVDDLDVDRDACTNVASFKWTSRGLNYNDEEQTHCCGDDQGKALPQDSSLPTHVQNPQYETVVQESYTPGHPIKKTYFFNIDDKNKYDQVVLNLTFKMNESAVAWLDFYVNSPHPSLESPSVMEVDGASYNNVNTNYLAPVSVLMRMDGIVKNQTGTSRDWYAYNGLNNFTIDHVKYPTRNTTVTVTLIKYLKDASVSSALGPTFVELYTDSLAGCWNGLPTPNNTLAGTSNETLFMTDGNTGKFYTCLYPDLHASLQDSLITGDVEDISSVCTNLGSWYCDYNWQWKNAYQFDLENKVDTRKINLLTWPGIYYNVSLYPLPAGPVIANTEACCPASYCFNGTTCENSLNYVNDPKKAPIFSLYGDAGYRCDEQGAWNVVSLKYDYNANDTGYCNEETSCYANSNRACLKSGEWDVFDGVDRMCYNGAWTTRTKYIANALLEYAAANSPDEFTLYCDRPENVFGEDIYGDISAMQFMLAENKEFTNYFFNSPYCNGGNCISSACALKFGNNILVGLPLNQPFNVTEYPVYEAFGFEAEQGNAANLEKISNDVEIDKVHLIYQSQRAGDLFYSKNKQVLFYTNDYSVDLIDATLLDSFLNTILNPIDSIVTFVQSIFTAPVDTAILDKVSDFDRVYFAKKGTKTITGFIETKFSDLTNALETALSVEYANFASDICTAADNAHLNCNVEPDKSTIFAANTTADAFSNIWPDLTAKVRLK